MNDYESLSHTTWTCKYHVVFIPKCRRKTLYLELRRHLRCSASSRYRRNRRSRKGISCPITCTCCCRFRRNMQCRKWLGISRARAQSILARVYGERKRNFVGQHFWARGFFVNTVGRDEEAIRAYIRNQEKEGSEARTIEPLALTMPPLGGSKLNGPRQRPVLPL